MHKGKNMFLGLGVVLGFIFCIATFFLAEEAPKEQTLDYKLQRLLYILAKKYHERGELPKDLDSTDFPDHKMMTFYEEHREQIHWYICKKNKIHILYSGTGWEKCLSLQIQ